MDFGLFVDFVEMENPADACKNRQVTVFKQSVINLWRYLDHKPRAADSFKLSVGALILISQMERQREASVLTLWAPVTSEESSKVSTTDCFSQREAQNGKRFRE